MRLSTFPRRLSAALTLRTSVSPTIARLLLLLPRTARFLLYSIRLARANRIEYNKNRAVRGRSNSSRAIVGETEVRRVRAADSRRGNVERRIPRVNDGQCLRGAGCSLRDGREGGRSWRKGDGRNGGDACAVQEKSLRAARGVICNLERGQQRANAGGRKVDAHRAVRVWSERCRAGICLRKTGSIRPGDGYEIDGKGLVTVIDDRKHLGWAGGANRNAAEICRGGKDGRRRTAESLNWIARDGDSRCTSDSGHPAVEGRSRNLREIPGLLVDLIHVNADAAEGRESVKVRAQGICDGGAQGKENVSQRPLNLRQGACDLVNRVSDDIIAGILRNVEKTAGVIDEHSSG